MNHRIKQPAWTSITHFFKKDNLIVKQNIYHNTKTKASDTVKIYPSIIIEVTCLILPLLSKVTTDILISWEIDFNEDMS